MARSEMDSESLSMVLDDGLVLSLGTVAPLVTSRSSAEVSVEFAWV